MPPNSIKGQFLAPKFTFLISNPRGVRIGGSIAEMAGNRGRTITNYCSNRTVHGNLSSVGRNVWIFIKVRRGFDRFFLSLAV